jgi:RNA polymerase sigma-70 factor (ECF subfamily)
VQLTGVLRQLSISRDREILRRYYLSDDDKEVICRDLGLSPGHFDRVLYRAKQRMRELIDRQDGLKAFLFGGLLDD